MPADPKGPDRFEEAWLDIPDPLAAPLRPVPAPPAPPAPSPTRREVRRRRAGGLFAFAAWPAAALALWGFREGLAEKTAFAVGQTVVWAAFLLLALMAPFAGARSKLGAPSSPSRWVATAVPIAFVALGVLWLPADARGAFADLGPLARLSPCLALGSLVALPLVALSAASMRHAFPSGAGSRGAALGAACGLAAALVLTLHCSSAAGGHIAVAHGAPLLLAILAGGWAGARWMRA